MTDIVTVLPAGFDPKNPDADRHTLAEAVLAEAKAHHGSADAFARAIYRIKQEQLYKFLPLHYETFEAFLLAEFRVSRRTGLRWVDQGREILAIDSAPTDKGAGQPVARVSQTGLARPDQPTIGVREAARLKAERKAREAGEAALNSLPPRATPNDADEPPATPSEARSEPQEAPHAPEAPPTEAEPWEAPEAPKPAKRVSRADQQAREYLERVLAVLRAFDPNDLARVATDEEKYLVTSFSLPFVKLAGRKRTVVVDQKTCPHPANRRIGTSCGLCKMERVSK